jgi:hypothetical protein
VAPRWAGEGEGGREGGREGGHRISGEMRQNVISPQFNLIAIYNAIELYYIALNHRYSLKGLNRPYL